MVDLDITLGQTPQTTPNDVIWLDDVPFPVVSVNYTDLSRFEPKITIGDYSKESDQLLSSWIQSSWSGGALVDEHIEGATDSRFRFSTLWTRSPGQLTLPPEFHRVAEGGSVLDGATDIRVIGDYDGDFYVSANGRLVEITMNPLSCPNYPLRPSVDVGALGGQAAGRGVVYQGKLLIPLGLAGLGTYDAATATLTVDATKPVVSLVLWDNKCFALQADGAVIIHDSTTWGAPAAARTLPSDRRPRHLVWFYDRGGNPTVFVVTDRDLWAWDAVADVLHPTRLRIPPHSANGLGCAEWRDDALYYTAGLGVYRYTGTGTISAIGLDRDDGLPTRIAHHLGNQQFGFSGGRIIDLVPEHNMIVAHVQGETTIDTTALPQEGEWEAGPFEGGQDLTATPPVAWSAIMLWNEAGWHCLRVADRPTQVQAPTPPSLFVSTSSDEYVLFAVEDGVLRQTFLSREFFGPRQLVQKNTDAVGPEQYARWFADAGFHETGRFDAGMMAFPKLASHFEVNVWNPNDGLPWAGPEPSTPAPAIHVFYRTDRSPTSWTHLGDVTSYGRTRLGFGKDGDGFYRGEPFDWIEFRYVFDNAPYNQHRPPVIDSTVLKFIKLPLEGRSWVFVLDLDLPDNGTFFDHGANELRDHLSALTASDSFTRMVHNNQTYRVRVSQAQGAESTGYFAGKAVTINVLHVPLAEVP